jgi:phage FluMu protein Com
MDCPRCHGLMVVEKFTEMEDCSGIPWMRGWRCMNCGEVLDRVIYQRRMTQNSLRDSEAKGDLRKGIRKSVAARMARARV